MASGTLGAFIQMKSIPKNRRHLLDVAIAGPLAGLIVAIPILLYGLHLSSVDRIPMSFSKDTGMVMEGNSILYMAIKYIAKGELLPQPASYGGLHPALYWLRYIFTGLPLPRGGTDVSLHQVAWAGWVGLLVTALNLIPAGQLDGGHLMYVLRGRRAVKLVPYILGALLLLGFIWTGWWLWAFFDLYLRAFLHGAAGFNHPARSAPQGVGYPGGDHFHPCVHPGSHDDGIRRLIFPSPLSPGLFPHLGEEGNIENLGVLGS